MALKSLIQNQKLRIDSHHSGKVIPDNLAGVHIHKSFYQGKRQSKSVKISIKGDKIDFDKDFDDDERRSIVNEINKILEKDKQKLIEFSRFLAKALYRWSQREVSVEEAKNYASGIAGILDLNPNASMELIKIVAGELDQYISVFSNTGNKFYSIIQTRKRFIIRPGSAI